MKKKIYVVVRRAYPVREDTPTEVVKGFEKRYDARVHRDKLADSKQGFIYQFWVQEMDSV